MTDSRPPAGRGLSFGAALFIGFGGLVAIAVALALYVALSTARDTAISLLNDKSDIILDRIAERIDIHLQSAWNQSEALAGAIARGNIPSDDTLRLSDYIAASMSATPQIRAMFYVNPELQALRVTRRKDDFTVELVDMSANDEVRRAAAILRERRDPYWGRLVWSPGLGTGVINLRMPVWRDGRFLGGIVAGISVDALSTFLGEQEDPLAYNTFVLYGHGQVLAHRALVGNGVVTSAEKPLPLIPEVGDPILNKAWLKGPPDDRLDAFDGRVQGTQVDLGDNDYILLYRVIARYGDVPWVIGTYFPLADVTPELERLIAAGAAGLVILLAGLVAAFFIGRSVSRPVRSLASAALVLKELDFAEVPPVRGGLFRETRDAASAFNAMISGLRAFAIYVPRSLVRRLVSAGGGADIVPEERRVTVLFTDIVGFTAQAEGLSPAETAAFLNSHLAIATRCVERTEGTVDKYIGDSVMAFWGAPGHQPDHARLACECASAIAEAIAEDNMRRLKAGDSVVRIRIGIHTGPAIVGNVGGPTRVDYTLVGDTVNTASRIVDLARAHLDGSSSATILASGDTVREAEAAFTFERIGEEELRGRQGRVGIWRLTGRVAGVDGAPPQTES